MAAVVLAVPPDVAQTLVPGLRSPARFAANVSVHFAVEPPFGMAPVTGLLNATATWLFAFEGRVSVTVNAAERLLDTPHEALAKTVWAEVAQAANLPVEPMPAWQVVTEPRAMFAALPDQETLRPGTRTRWNNLMLAGDWTATGLPATIEGAIRSGQKAADQIFLHGKEHSERHRDRNECGRRQNLPVAATRAQEFDNLVGHHGGLAGRVNQEHLGDQKVIPCPEKLEDRERGERGK